MNAYGAVQNWIQENRDKAFFPPLDETGQSFFAEGRETAVFLYAQPEPPKAGEDPFFLYLPLVSVVGLADPALLEFLTEIAEANLVGALPTGYRIFYQRGPKQVYLGGQFSPNAFDAVSFRDLTENFARYGRLLSRNLADRLVELAREFAGTAPNRRPSVPPPDFSEAPPSYLTGLLKI
jgi:hypothetical protein